MMPTPREIELERAEVTARAATGMDDTAEFGAAFNRVDLRACAGQLSSTNLELPHDQERSH